MRANRTITLAVDIVRGAKFGAGVAVFDQIVDAVGNVTTVIKDATVQSGKMAAAYERTENSLRSFAGSTRRAGEELKAVSKLAENTPGLRLESAELGYQRLRSVGFEAEKARRLLAGLGKEKILSGADNSAIEKVIFNFGQLKAGAQSFNQEAREILTQLPSLRRQFLDAFGTLNPQKIQALFDTNPNAFFDKLSASMEKTQGISSDTIDSFEKFQDEITKIGREAGKPMLDPLTEQFTDLAKFIKDNKDVWTDWGQYVGDIIRGLPKLSEQDMPKPTKQSFGGYVAEGFSDIANFLMDNSSTGGIARELSGEKSAERGRAERLAREGNSFVKAQRDKLKREADSFNEVRTELANKEFERIQEQELHNTQALRILESYHSSRLSIIENASKIELAALDAGLNLTLESQRNVIQKQGQSRAASLKTQLAVDSAYFKEQLRLNADNKLELEKIELEKGNTLRKIQADIVLNEINSQKQLDRIDREIIERKRAAVQELKQIQTQQARQSLDTSSFNFDRSISTGSFDASAFNRFRDELSRFYSDLTQLSSELYREQLLNESLTAEETLNIIKKKNVEQVGLAEDLRRKLLDISERQYSEQSKQLETYSQKLQSAYQSQIGLYSQVGNILSSQNFGKKISEEIGLTFFGGDYDAFEAPILAKIEEHQKLKTQLESLIGKNVDPIFGTGGDPIKLSEKYGAINTVLSEQQKALENLEGKYSKNSIEIFRYSKALANGTASINDFDNAQKLLLKTSQALELTKLDSRLNFLQGEREKAQTENPSEAARIKQEIQSLTDEKVLTQLRQASDAANLYSNSLVGLAERLQQIRSGDAGTILGLQVEAQKQILREQIGLVNENIILQERLANVGANAADRYKNAWLSATLEVRDANISAVESQIAAQVRLADASTIHVEQVRAQVLEHLASAKTATDALADGIISAFDKTANYFDKLLGKFGDIPILGDLAKFGGRNLLSGVATDLLDRFLPSGIADQFRGKTGNPVVDKLADTNSILKDIRDGKGGIGSVTNIISGAGNQSGGSNSVLGRILGLFTGGNKIGATPNFNPNLFAGGTFGAMGGFGGLASNPFGGSAAQRGILSIEQLLGTGAGNTTRQNPLQQILSGNAGLGNVGLGGAAKNPDFLTKLLGSNAGGILAGAGLGAGFGSQLGGSSTLGRILGGIGGGAIGAVGAAALPAILAGTFAGVTALGAATLGIGFALLPAAYLIGRNAQRNSDERKRSQYRDEAVGQLNQLIQAAKQGNPEAISKGEEVRQRYIEISSQLKDKKTRNIALNELNPPNILFQKFKQLQEANQQGLFNTERRSRILPEFAGGNYFGRDDQIADMQKALDMRRGYINGGRIGVDRHLGLFADGEIIANKTHQQRIINAAGFDVFAHAGIPNYPKPKTIKRYADGASFGTPAAPASTAKTENSGFSLELHNCNFGEDSKAYLNTPDGKRHVINIIKEGARTRSIPIRPF